MSGSSGAIPAVSGLERGQFEDATTWSARVRERTEFLTVAPDLVKDGFDLSGRVRAAAVNRYFGEWDIEPGDDDDLKVLASLHSGALSTMQEVLAAINAVATDDDPSLNSAGRLKIAAQLVEPKIKRLSDTVSNHLARVDEAITSEEAAVHKATRVVDPVDLASLESIRSYWRSADAEKARRLLTIPTDFSGTDEQAARSRGGASLDTATLQALVLVPHYICGLTEEEHEYLRGVLADRVAPDRVKRLAAMRRGKALVTQATTAAEARANKYINFRKARELLELEAKRQAQQ